jgi:hypothetical protein
LILVKRAELKGKRVIKSRYVFTRKASSLAKARICLKDFRKKGQDTQYSPVAEDASLKMMLTLVATDDLDLYQYDVESAFLWSDMDEEVHMDVPEGCELPTGYQRSDWAILVTKSLYGHRKVPYLWNKELNATLLNEGFVSSSGDACLYVKRIGPKVLYLLLHVDDFLIADNNKIERERIIDRSP